MTGASMSGESFQKQDTLEVDTKVRYTGSAPTRGIAIGTITRVHLTDDDGVLYWVRWDAPNNGADGSGQAVGPMPYPRRDLAVWHG